MPCFLWEETAVLLTPPPAASSSPWAGVQYPPPPAYGVVQSASLLCSALSPQFLKTACCVLG